MRAACALEIGDVEQGVADLNRLTQLTAPSTSALSSVSMLSYYLLSPSTQALATLKQCLHYDPDSKICASAHRQLKKFDKTLAAIQKALEGSNWPEAIKLVEDFAPKFDSAMETALNPKSLDLEGGLPAGIVPKRKSVKRREIYHAACRAYFESQLIKQAASWCKEVTEMEGGENNLDALKALAELSIIDEEWEAAVRYLERAFEASGRSNNDIHQRLQRAHRLLKQSKKKDYYKIIGVPRDADIRTIKKAYRKAAKNAHPDKGGSEAQMAALNQAYEVLSDEELRARYDNGDDPNDPTSGNPFMQQGGNPFVFFQQSHGHGRGNPLGGNPFGGPQFRFSFQH